MPTQPKEKWLALTLTTTVFSIVCYPILFGFVSTQIPELTNYEALKLALCLLPLSLLWLSRWSIQPIYYVNQIMYSLVGWFLILIPACELLKRSHHEGWNEYYIVMTTTVLFIVIDALYTFHSKRHKSRESNVR